MVDGDLEWHKVVHPGDSPLFLKTRALLPCMNVFQSVCMYFCCCAYELLGVDKNERTSIEIWRCHTLSAFPLMTTFCYIVCLSVCIVQLLKLFLLFATLCDCAENTKTNIHTYILEYIYIFICTCTHTMCKNMS